MATMQDTFKVYDEFFHSGFAERIAQRFDLFNAAVNNTILLRDEFIMGQFARSSFHVQPGGVSERDPTTNGTAASADMTQEEEISVKLARRYGPFDKSADSWKQMGSDPMEMSFLLGSQAADAAMQDCLNTGVAACLAAVKNQATNTLNVTAETPGSISHKAMNRARAKLGDASPRIGAYVFHGTSWHELVGDAIDGGITNVADVAINQGTTATLGKPSHISDIPGLINTVPTPDELNVLGLLPGAIDCVRSEPGTLLFGPVMDTQGRDNIIYRFQWEYTWNLAIRGFKWDIANGGAYPNAAALTTGSNWDKVMTSHKDLAGIVLVHDSLEG